MTLKRILTLSSLLLIGSSINAAFAGNYPFQYQYDQAGFNPALPLQQKLNTTRGEYLFEDSGLYFGASDAVYQDRIVSEDHYEMDAYAGWKKSLGKFGYNLGLKSYNRSIVKNIEVQELYVGGSFEDLSVSYATNDEGEYTQMNLMTDVSSIRFGLHVGKTKPVVGEEFADWSVHASKMYRNVTFNAIMTKSDNPFNKETQFNVGFQRALSLF